MKDEGIKMNNSKKEALSNYLGVENENEIEQIDEDNFSYDNADYIVWTDEQAQTSAEQYIRDSLWAFNVDFIADHAKANLNKTARKAIAEMQGALCEDANPINEAIIDDIDDFINDAIETDGRGHFLNTYDGKENEQDGYYIYRVN
jgi:hypothetical protein